MLKFNSSSSAVLSTSCSNLNTSHVKVQLDNSPFIFMTEDNLNTSHVKVQLVSKVRSSKHFGI